MVILAGLLGQATIALGATAGAVYVYDLADYRLTPEVFEQFVQASGRIADITQHDPAFKYAAAVHQGRGPVGRRAHDGAGPRGPAGESRRACGGSCGREDDATRVRQVRDLHSLPRTWRMAS